MKRSGIFILTGIGLGVFGLAVATIAVLLVRLVFSDDSFAVIGLGVIGALAGYTIGNAIGLLVLHKGFHRGGSLARGFLLILAWAIAGFLAAMLFAEINLNPWITFIFFYATLPFIGLGAYSLKKHR